MYNVTAVNKKESLSEEELRTLGCIPFFDKVSDDESTMFLIGSWYDTKFLDKVKGLIEDIGSDTEVFTYETALNSVQKILYAVIFKESLLK